LKLKHLHEDGEPLEHEDMFEADIYALAREAARLGWHVGEGPNGELAAFNPTDHSDFWAYELQDNQWSHVSGKKAEQLPFCQHKR
jgi:hypothetical protein